MKELNTFYKNITVLSGLEIIKFIYKETNNQLTQLIQLNSEFNNLIVREMEEKVRVYKSPDYKPADPFIENLIDDNCDSSTPTDTKSVLVVDYFLVNGVIDFKEEELKFEMLQYRDYNRINYKIKEFQRFIKAEIESHKTFEKEELIDLSDSTATEKIIYLNELGIIDFLRDKQPFNTTVNRLATVLSALTGEKAGTIQSYLNPTLNSNTAQKNNPLIKTEKVKKIKQILIEIGFNLNKSI